MDERYENEVTVSVARELRAASRFMLGLRYDEHQILEWITQDMSWLRESSLYQIAVAEGRVEEARRLVVELGAERLGPPAQAVVDAIERIDDHDELKRLIRRTFTASSWQELLATE